MYQGPSKCAGRGTMGSNVQSTCAIATRPRSAAGLTANIGQGAHNGGSTGNTAAAAAAAASLADCVVSSGVSRKNLPPLQTPQLTSLAVTAVFLALPSLQDPHLMRLTKQGWGGSIFSTASSAADKAHNGGSE